MASAKCPLKKEIRQQEENAKSAEQVSNHPVLYIGKGEGKSAPFEKRELIFFTKVITEIWKREMSSKCGAERVETHFAEVQLLFCLKNSLCWCWKEKTSFMALKFLFKEETQRY